MKKVIKGFVLCIISVMLFSHFATLKKPNAQNSNENSEWYQWFNSLTEEQQGKVSFRPSDFWSPEEWEELRKNISLRTQNFLSLEEAEVLSSFQESEIIGGQNLPLNTPTPLPTSTPKPTVTPKPTLTPTPVSVKGIVAGDYNTTYGDIEEDYNKCIEELEKTVDLDEWYAWFDSLSPDNQEKVNFRPAGFYEHQQDCVRGVFSTAAADVKIDSATDMDKTDVIISAYSYVMGAFGQKTDKDKQIVVTNILPLYTMSDRVVAYYITFSTGEYAVINNNNENPVAIEFGRGKQKFIEEILSQDSGAKIIYNNQVSVYSKEFIGSLSEEDELRINDIYECFPNLLIKNEFLSQWLKESKEKILKEEVITSTKGDGDFGFFSASQMSLAPYHYSGTIIDATQVDWAIMSDYDSIADNHCGATTVTNLALYYHKRGYSYLKLDNDKYATFVDVHGIIGNGPVMNITNGAKDYFLDRGYNLQHSSLSTGLLNSGIETFIATATRNNKPCAILLFDGVTSWHWVLGVGWFQYAGAGGFYIRINTNWDGHVDTYYMPGNGSTVFSVTEYWL